MRPESQFDAMISPALLQNAETHPSQRVHPSQAQKNSSAKAFDLASWGSTTKALLKAAWLAVLASGQNLRCSHLAPVLTLATPGVVPISPAIFYELSTAGKKFVCSIMTTSYRASTKPPV
jgi:hypothetical protein